LRWKKTVTNLRQEQLVQLVQLKLKVKAGSSLWGCDHEMGGARQGARRGADESKYLAAGMTALAWNLSHADSFFTFESFCKSEGGIIILSFNVRMSKFFLDDCFT